MKSRIEEIKKLSKEIDIDQLIKTGKCDFYKKHFTEFEDSIGSEYILDEIYTAYNDNNKLVLECLMKYCGHKTPDDPTLCDLDYTTNRDIIYMDGTEVKELRIEENIEEDDIEEDKKKIHKEVSEVIKNANKKSIIQKQHIRNFFRRIFKGKNSNLLEGESINLTKEEIEGMIEFIQEKPEKFIDKYNKEKSKEEREFDALHSQEDKSKESKEEER